MNILILIWNEYWLEVTWILGGFGYCIIAKRHTMDKKLERHGIK